MAGSGGLQEDGLQRYWYWSDGGSGGGRQHLISFGVRAISRAFCIYMPGDPSLCRGESEFIWV